MKPALGFVRDPEHNVFEAGVEIGLEICAQPPGRAGVHGLERGDHLEWTAVPALDRRAQTPGAIDLEPSSDTVRLTLLTTLTRFATAIDVTISELTLEAFLPADEATARYFQTDRS